MFEVPSHRSEGFSRTGYLLPARGTPGVSPDGESCWDVVVAAAAVVVIWNFRSTFWLGNYIWSLSLWNWALVEALETLRPGFCTEFRYLSYGQSGLAWGAIFEKSPKIKKIHFLRKWTCPKNLEMSFSRKKPPEAQCRKRSRKLLRILGYIYIYMRFEIYSYITSFKK